MKFRNLSFCGRNGTQVVALLKGKRFWETLYFVYVYIILT